VLVIANPGGREKVGAPKASAASCRITPVTSDQWMERDRERRETVERYHRLKDIEEDFVVAKQAAKTREER
jgi:hypothetical protein